MHALSLKNTDTVPLSWLITIFDTSQHQRVLRVHPLMKSISGEMSPYYNSQKQRTLADLRTAALQLCPTVVLQPFPICIFLLGCMFILRISCC